MGEEEGGGKVGGRTPALQRTQESTTCSWWTLASSARLDYDWSYHFKGTLVTSAFFPVTGFQESCDLQARPLGHGYTVATM